MTQALIDSGLEDVIASGIIRGSATSSEVGDVLLLSGDYNGMTLAGIWLRTDTLTKHEED
jgi:hypothetical protein